MSRLLGLAQVPVFVEKGDAKVTTEFGKDIPDYPTKGKTGDHWGLDIVRCSDGSSSELANICAIADSLDEARSKVYSAAKVIDFEGKYYRNDIGLI